jgi:hypothetical protein
MLMPVETSSTGAHMIDGAGFVVIDHRLHDDDAAHLVPLTSSPTHTRFDVLQRPGYCPRSRSNTDQHSIGNFSGQRQHFGTTGAR